MRRRGTRRGQRAKEAPAEEEENEGSEAIPDGGEARTQHTQVQVVHVHHYPEPPPRALPCAPHWSDIPRDGVYAHFISTSGCAPACSPACAPACVSQCAPDRYYHATSGHHHHPNYHHAPSGYSSGGYYSGGYYPEGYYSVGGYSPARPASRCYW